LVSKPALTILNGLQPYAEGHGAEGPHEHPLPLIKEIADSDKHRVLAAALIYADLSKIGFTWNSSVASDPTSEPLVEPGTAVIPGTPIVRIRFAKGNAKANVKVYRQPEFDVRFRSDTWVLRFRNVEDSLKWACERLYRFSPLFPTR
jgi:hypothetical protein